MTSLPAEGVRLLGASAELDHRAILLARGLDTSGTMLLTLREVLDYDVCRRGGATVATCAEDLDRPVRWAHNSEITDIASFLRGGEILLTAGLGVGQTSEEQRRYVDALADAGAAALMLELGRAFKDLPSAMATEATRRHLPIITLDREIRFMDVTERVQSTLINRQHEQLKRAEKIGEQMNALLLREESLETILERLAEMLGNPLVLEDAAHQVVAHARLSHNLFNVLGVDGWEKHSRSGHRAGDQAPASVCLEPGSPSCVWTAIQLRGETVGRLHVLEVNTRLGEIDYLSVDRASAAIGIAMLADRHERHLDDQAHTTFFSDIQKGRIISLDELVARARALRVDLAGRHLAAVAVQGLVGLPDESNVELVPSQRILEQMHVAGDVEQCALIAVAGTQRVLGLLGLPLGRRSTGSCLEGFAERLASGMVRADPEAVLVVGTSDIGGAEVDRALSEAAEALSYGRLLGRSGLIRFRDIGYHHLLFYLSGSTELSRFVEAQVGPLLEHDAASRIPLLPTLRTYLECGGSKSATSERLYLQRRSLYDRLRRIEDVLGCDLNDVETRARLHLALRSLDVVRSRTGADH